MGVEEGSDQGKFWAQVDAPFEDRLWASKRAAIKVNSQVDAPFEDRFWASKRAAIKVNFSQVDVPFEDRFDLGVEEGSDQGKFSSRRSL